MKLGVIGAGNMGSAIIQGCISAGMEASNVIVCGHHAAKLNELEQTLGTKTAGSETELASSSDIILVAVKPKDATAVLSKIAAIVESEKKLVISIAAGKSMVALAEALCSDKCKIVRAMPNTPAMVGEGMTALCRNENVTDEEFSRAMKIFEGIGRANEVPENLMDAVTGLSGSGPAFVYMFIESLADGAVFSGMTRAQAYEFAAQTVLGSAKMVLETGKHPGELKDAVCSPKGTTITGVRKLENEGFRQAVMDAVIAAAEKSHSM